MVSPMSWTEAFVVHSITEDEQNFPRVIQFANGRMGLFWTSENRFDTGDVELHYRLLDPFGREIGSDSRAGFLFPEDVDQPDATMLNGAAAGLAVTYIREDEAHGDDRVYAQLLLPDGTWSSEILVNRDVADTHPANPRILAMPQGGFLVIWNEENPDDNDDDDVLARLFGSNFQPLGDQITINASTPDDQVQPDAAIL